MGNKMKTRFYLDKHKTVEAGPGKFIPGHIKRSILQCSKGYYQEQLLIGHHNWSGASLTGNARKFGTKYQQSRNNLASRIHYNLPPDWKAEVKHVLYDGRWHTELVLTNQGIPYVF